MSDLISRQAVLDILKHSGVWHDRIEAIEELPSAEPKRNTGKWISDTYGFVICSECGWCAPRVMTGCLADRYLDYAKSEFCWRCGADMRGEQDETENIIRRNGKCNG